MYARVGDIDDIMIGDISQRVGNDANIFEELRAIWAAWEGRTSSEPCKL